MLPWSSPQPRRPRTKSVHSSHDTSSQKTSHENRFGPKPRGNIPRCCRAAPGGAAQPFPLRAAEHDDELFMSLHAPFPMPRVEPAIGGESRRESSANALVDAVDSLNPVPPRTAHPCLAVRGGHGAVALRLGRRQVNLGRRADEIGLQNRCVTTSTFHRSARPDQPIRSQRSVPASCCEAWRRHATAKSTHHSKATPCMHALRLGRLRRGGRAAGISLPCATLFHIPPNQRLNRRGFPGAAQAVHHQHDRTASRCQSNSDQPMSNLLRCQRFLRGE